MLKDILEQKGIKVYSISYEEVVRIVTENGVLVYSYEEIERLKKSRTRYEKDFKSKRDK